MVYYLNRGFIAEQALRDIFDKYFRQLRFSSLYENFHLSVTNEHPFARLIASEDGENAADLFPSIIVTTQADSKVAEFSDLSERCQIVELDADDIDEICATKRIKTYIDNEGNEQTVTKNGSVQYENIAGYCTVTDDNAIDEIKAYIAENENIKGVQYTASRRDRISVEVWCDNAQLKNEIYEQLRLFITASLNDVLHEKYRMFSPAVFTKSVTGERSNNYNFDFDVTLYGGHISFDIDYAVAQLILDTEAEDVKDIELKAVNHVYG